VKTFGGKSMNLRLIPMILHKALIRAGMNHSRAFSGIDFYAPSVSYDHLLRKARGGYAKQITTRNTLLDPDKLQDYLAEYFREENRDTATLLRLLTMLHPDSPLQPLMTFPRSSQRNGPFTRGVPRSNRSFRAGGRNQ